MDSAREAARELIEKRYAACVNILPRATSIYSWEDAIQEDQEYLMIVKTTKGRYPRLESALVARHPYELPEIIAFPITEGLPGYLSWIAAQTHPTAD